MENCPIHQTPWKIVPAGVSKKTGKPYSSFKSCQNRECKEKPPREDGYKKPVQGPDLKVIEDLVKQMNAMNSVLSEIRISALETKNLLKEIVTKSIPF